MGSHPYPSAMSGSGSVAGVIAVVAVALMGTASVGANPLTSRPSRGVAGAHAEIQPNGARLDRAVDDFLTSPAVVDTAATARAIHHATVRHATVQPGAWPTVRHDSGNTGDDAHEVSLSTKTVDELHPVGRVPDRRISNGPMIESHGRLYATCRPSRHRRVRICAWRRSDWHLLWSNLVPGLSGDDEFTLVAAGPNLIAHWDSDSYVGLRQRDGHRLFTVKDAHPEVTTDVPPPVVHGRVFSYFNNLLDLVQRSTVDGHVVRRVSLSHLANTTANRRVVAEVAGDIVAGGRIFILGDDPSFEIRALPLTCTTAACPEDWNISAPADASQLAYSAGKIFSDGNLNYASGIHAYNARTGALLFTLAEPGAYFLQNVFVADNLVFATDYYGRIQAWPRDGCGQPSCLPVMDVSTSRYPTDEATVEVGGELYAPRSYIYELSTRRRSPYRAPGLPTAVAATWIASSCEVQLSWTPPSETGGLPVTASRVTASDGETVDGSYNAASYGYTLPAGNYTFSVQEQTALGWGPATALTAPLQVPTCTD
jgi:hypothetical protein